MSVVRVLVALAHISALPEDSATNTFHFATSTPPVATELDNIETGIENFYLADGGAWGGDSLVEFMSRELSGAATVKYYNLDDPTPRAPIRTETFSFTPPATDNALPEEVALVVSFQGTPISGEPQARRRGRLYIGPINGSANTVDGRPTTAFRNRLRLGAENLMADVNTVWGVWSPTDSAFVTVTNGWVDNAFDTQRRRGQAATARSLFP